MKRNILLLTLLTILASASNAQNLYRTTMTRAAPGKLLELIEYLKTGASKAGVELNLMRHSQGDHWDLMLVEPIDSYGGEGLLTSKSTNGVLEDAYGDLVSWKEELIVVGPEHDEFRAMFNDAGFFHIEIFVALAGKRKELFKEREMENAYLEKLGRGINQIFVKTQGAKWDMFTIGYYKDLKDYANSSDSSPEESESAAKAAGFESAGTIGAYLRNFISEHHDTLAVKIN